VTTTTSTGRSRNAGGRNGTRDADITDNSRNALLDEDDDGDDDDVIDESGADDAFVAGMIFALSRRVLPNPTYSPIAAPTSNNNKSTLPYLSRPSPAVEDDLEKGRWRLEECLRFATEMAGRKVRIKGFQGLARAMENVGWFED